MKRVKPETSINPVLPFSFLSSRRARKLIRLFRHATALPISPHRWSFLFSFLVMLGFASGYIYNYQDWFNLPSVKTIHSITTDLSNVYIGTPEAIYIFDKSEKSITRTLTSSDGIQGVIRICAYDRESGLLWIVADNKLIGFNPKTNFIITLYPNFYIRSLGVNSSYLYFLTDGKPQRMQNRTGPLRRLINWIPTLSGMVKKILQYNRLFFLVPHSTLMKMSQGMISQWYLKTVKRYGSEPMNMAF